VHSDYPESQTGRSDHLQFPCQSSGFLSAHVQNQSDRLQEESNLTSCPDIASEQKSVLVVKTNKTKTQNDHALKPRHFSAGFKGEHSEHEPSPEDTQDMLTLLEESNPVQSKQQSRMMGEVSSLTPLPKNDDSNMADVSDINDIRICTAIQEEEEEEERRSL